MIDMTGAQKTILKERIIRHGGWWETICERCGDITFSDFKGMILKPQDRLRHRNCGGLIIKNEWHVTIPDIKQFCKHCGKDL